MPNPRDFEQALTGPSGVGISNQIAPHLGELGAFLPMIMPTISGMIVDDGQYASTWQRGNTVQQARQHIEMARSFASFQEQVQQQQIAFAERQFVSMGMPDWAASLGSSAAGFTGILPYIDSRYLSTAGIQNVARASYRPGQQVNEAQMLSAANAMAGYYGTGLSGGLDMARTGGYSMDELASASVEVNRFMGGMGIVTQREIQQAQQDIDQAARRRAQTIANAFDISDSSVIDRIAGGYGSQDELFDVLSAATGKNVDQVRTRFRTSGVTERIGQIDQEVFGGAAIGDAYELAFGRRLSTGVDAKLLESVDMAKGAGFRGSGAQLLQFVESLEGTSSALDPDRVNAIARNIRSLSDSTGMMFESIQGFIEVADAAGGRLANKGLLARSVMSQFSNTEAFEGMSDAEQAEARARITQFYGNTQGSQYGLALSYILGNASDSADAKELRTLIDSGDSDKVYEKMADLERNNFKTLGADNARLLTGLTSGRAGAAEAVTETNNIRIRRLQEIASDTSRTQSERDEANAELDRVVIGAQQLFAGDVNDLIDRGTRTLLLDRVSQETGIDRKELIRIATADPDQLTSEEQDIRMTQLQELSMHISANETVKESIRSYHATTKAGAVSENRVAMEAKARELKLSENPFSKVRRGLSQILGFSEASEVDALTGNSEYALVLQGALNLDTGGPDPKLVEFLSQEDNQQDLLIALASRGTTSEDKEKSASEIETMLLGKGFSEDKAAKYSERMVERAHDVASQSTQEESAKQIAVSGAGSKMELTGTATLDTELGPMIIRFVDAQITERIGSIPDGKAP